MFYDIKISVSFYNDNNNNNRTKYLDINFDELRFGCPLKFSNKFYDCFFQLCGAYVFGG